MRTRAERRWSRFVKGRRRLRDDRAQHGGFRDCPCFAPPGTRAFGRLFGQLADTPRRCSCPLCGNPRRYPGVADAPLTVQERRALLDDA